MLLRTLTAVLALLLALPLQAASEQLLDVNSPRGANTKFLLIQPESPKAAVILFAGGKGALKLYKGMFGGPGINWGAKNFLVRTRADFAKHGLMVATIDAPSDHLGKKGMLGGFRSSLEHVQDIDAIIARLREIADVPIWLVGTSRGTESVTNAAIHSQQSPHGLVLTSSMTDGDHKGQAVTDFNLSKIRIPTLITHHQNDNCSKTRPEAIENIREGLTQAPEAQLLWFKGGREQSKPCKAMSHHGYLGIEDQVVDAIAQFILSH